MTTGTGDAIGLTLVSKSLNCFSRSPRYFSISSVASSLACFNLLALPEEKNCLISECYRILMSTQSSVDFQCLHCKRKSDWRNIFAQHLLSHDLNFQNFTNDFLRFLASPTLSAAFFSAASSCWIPAEGLVILQNQRQTKINQQLNEETMWNYERTESCD